MGYNYYRQGDFITLFHKLTDKSQRGLFFQRYMRLAFQTI